MINFFCVAKHASTSVSSIKQFILIEDSRFFLILKSFFDIVCKPKVLTETTKCHVSAININNLPVLFSYQYFLGQASCLQKVISFKKKLICFKFVGFKIRPNIT